MKKNILLTDIAAALETIQAYTSLLQTIYGSEEDIHRYTAQLGKIYHEIFYPIDQRLELTSYSAERFQCAVTTLLGINQFNERDSSALTSILNSIQNHNLIESETGLNPQELLTRIYALIQQPAFAYNRDSILSVLIENLEHNIKAGGGCLAGICARLTQVYFALLSDFLNTIQHTLVSEPEHQDLEAEFDAEMDLGLALSQSAYESKQCPIYSEFEPEFESELEKESQESCALLSQFQSLKDFSVEDFSNLINGLDGDPQADDLVLAWHQLHP